jgi:hypothetical protein
MNGRKMADEIEDPVLAGRNMPLKFLVTQGGNGLAKVGEDELPGIECGADVKFFVCHTFVILELRT